MKKIDKKSIIFLAITVLGLALSVYLVLNFQTILSRAGSTDYTNFEVKDAQDNPIACDSNGICNTKTLDVKLKIKDLEKLSE